jgi:hypothetical protein
MTAIVRLGVQRVGARLRPAFHLHLERYVDVDTPTVLQIGADGLRPCLPRSLVRSSYGTGEAELLLEWDLDDASDEVGGASEYVFDGPGGALARSTLGDGES